MGREIADLTARMKKWDSIVFIDDNKNRSVVDEIEVFTLTEILEKYSRDHLEFIVTAGEPTTRRLLYKRLKELELSTTKVIDPEFNLSRFSSLGSGTIMHTGAIITVNVHIGKGCLINKHVVIGHDVNVGNYSVLSPNVTVGGNTNIGDSCYLGSGALIKNGITIGENSIIGMGAVVLNDVEPNSVMVGNPAKLLRKNETGKVF